MIHFKNIKEIRIPEGKIAKITRKTDGFLLWKSPASFTNLLALSTEADGTPYNGGLGYRAGNRVRSGGAETYYTDLAFCTGFIPYAAGSVLRIYSPYGFFNSGAVPAINVYDENQTVLGQAAYNGKYGIMAKSWVDYVSTDSNGMIILTIPASENRADEITSVRLSLCLAKTPPDISAGMAETIITADEEFSIN